MGLSESICDPQPASCNQQFPLLPRLFCKCYHHSRPDACDNLSCCRKAAPGQTVFVRDFLPETIMNHRTFLITAACLLAASVILSAEAGNTLNAARARDILRRLGGAELPKAQVRVINVQPGLTGREVVVEAQVETAYRFMNTATGWKIAEVRLGDRQWESVELVTEAVRREKNRRTAALMQQIAQGLEAYRRDQSSYPNADNIIVLLDQLAPRYVSASLRFDLWGMPFSYRGTAAGYQLTSAGNDKQPGTNDDLMIENGTLRPLPE
jgi:Type II secretion system (T2SS), protein G